ncbi:hypothetical protein F5Y16DRAFT_424595 [Xylariaceae sp. FL0255]|nr:hypothetical protein F5Y16DRAFT_424595 [Xylariaceae sp. FL0255]
MASLQYLEPAGTIRATQLPEPANSGLSATFGSLNTSRDPSLSPSQLQNRRVRQIQQNGFQFSPQAYANQLNQQQQFFASGSSSCSSPNVNQQNRAGRPPVPLFSQSLGNTPVQQSNMDLGGMQSSPPDAKLNDHSQETDAISGLGFPTRESGSYPSPAGFDMSVSSASSSVHLGTISPSQLVLGDHELYQSAPDSNALTNLTTPSDTFGSPDFDAFHGSPNFGDMEASELWQSAPLFPQENSYLNQSSALKTQAPAQDNGQVDGEAELLSDSRRKSSTSPTTTKPRHSSTSGVSSRRRDKPLPAIVVDDPNDSVAMKRARNTLAARKSRERKAMVLEEKTDKIVELEELLAASKNREDQKDRQILQLQQEMAAYKAMFNNA